jgi:hypothetical protein
MPKAAYATALTGPGTALLAARRCLPDCCDE